MDIELSRQFVEEVLARAYELGLNVFVVTDGAYGTSNNGNPAVANARQAQVAWEQSNGFNPDEDWGKGEV